jgi:hypothetical protein
MADKATPPSPTRVQADRDRKAREDDKVAARAEHRVHEAEDAEKLERLRALRREQEERTRTEREAAKTRFAPAAGKAKPPAAKKDE